MRNAHWFSFLQFAVLTTVIALSNVRADNVILFENFEGTLDPRISVTNRGSFLSLPDVRSTTTLGGSRAFGYGFSTCDDNCNWNYAAFLTLSFPGGTNVAQLSFKAFEVGGDSGSAGYVFLDPPSLPTSEATAVAGFRPTGSNTFSVPINRTVTNIVLAVEDILGASESTGEIYIDEIQVAGPQPCAQICDGIIGWWRAEDDVRDSIGGSFGDLANGAGYASGLVGQSFSFDGIDDYAEIPDSDLWAFGTNDFSVELWARFLSVTPSSVGVPGDILIGNDENLGTFRKWFFALGGGQLYFHVNGPGTPSVFLAQTPFDPVLGQWYHLAAIRSNDVFRIYVNGNAVSSETNAVSIPNPDAPLTIGWAEENGYFHGQIDEPAIFSRALSAQEIASIYAAGSSGKCVCQAPPTIDISNATVREGNSGTTNAVFGLTLSRSNSQPVSVSFVTMGGSATAGDDYQATNGVVVFNPGELNKSIVVPVYGDTLLEPDESFLVALASPANATLTRTQAIGFILNDDTNTPPSVALVSPMEGAMFSVGAVIAISAVASDADGTVTQVEFFADGTNRLWVSTNAPYTFVWSNLTAGNYALTARALDNDGLSATSLPVNISVVAVSGLTNISVCAGGTAMFSANVLGSENNYAWRHDGALLPGQTNATLLVAPVTVAQAGVYSFEINGQAAASATLSVRTNVTLAAIPDHLVCQGSGVTLSAVATGTGPFTFAWVKDGSLIAGATNSSFTIPIVVSSNAGIYTVQATGPCNVASTSAALTLDGTPLMDVTVCAGQSATFSTMAAGGASVPTFLWRKNGTVIPGRTNSSLTITNVVAADAGIYSVEINGCTRVTNSAVLTVGTLITATMPTNVVACSCSDVVLAPAVSGAGPFIYSWKREGHVLPGETNATLALGKGNTVRSGYYSVEITGPCSSVTNRTFLEVINLTSAVFSDTNGVSIPDFGAGAPYPSTILVRCAPRTITRLRVTLRGLSHTYPQDLDIMLAGPSGQRIMLMSDAIGTSAFALDNVTLSFADTATNTLPASGAVVTGDYSPTNYPGGDADSFPAPAPGGPNAILMSAFYGTDPNGVWSLYIVDDHGQDAGSLAGWSLDFGPDWFQNSGTSLSDPVMLPGGAFQMQLNGEPDKTYFIEASPDLQNWDLIQTHHLTAPSMTITDATAPEFHYRFYRASGCLY